MKVFLLTILLSAAAFAQSPAVIERELVGHLKAMEASGSYSGNYDDAKLAAASTAFKTKLLKAAKRKDTLSYQFAKLGEEIFVRTSKDGKLRVYSWDLQSGGTMHDYDMIVQYVGNGGAVKAWSSEDDEDNSGGAYYHDIFQLNAGTKPIYLLISTARASTSYLSEGLRTVTIDNGVLNMNSNLIRTGEGITNSIGFGYDYFSVVDSAGHSGKLFKFNVARKEFSFPVVVEDEKTPQGRVTNKRITYRFNGKSFVKVS